MSVWLQLIHRFARVAVSFTRTNPIFIIGIASKKIQKYPLFLLPLCHNQVKSECGYLRTRINAINLKRKKTKSKCAAVSKFHLRHEIEYSAGLTSAFNVSTAEMQASLNTTLSYPLRMLFFHTKLAHDRHM